MASDKRASDLYVDVFRAIQRNQGGSTNQIGKQVAHAIGESEQYILDTKKESKDGFKLEKNFKKRLDNALKRLWTDDKIFKKYTRLNGDELSEDEIQSESLKGSQYNTYFYATAAGGQIDNEGLLTNLGVDITPLNNWIKFSCDEMSEKRPSPKSKSQLLFINDYRWGINLEFSHEDLPHSFIFTKKYKSSSNKIEDIKDFLVKNDYSTKQATVVELTNNNYDYKDVGRDYIILNIDADKNIFIQNFSTNDIKVGSDFGFYDEKILRQNILENAGDCKDPDKIKQIIEKTYKELLQSDGFDPNKEISLAPNHKSENLQAFSPIYFEMLQYVVVLDKGF